MIFHSLGYVVQHVRALSPNLEAAGFVFQIEGNNIIIK